MQFEFATAQRILFGLGALKEIGPLAASLGKKPLVVTGASPARADRLLALLTEAGLSAAVFSAAGEPSVNTVRTALAQADAERTDLVVGFGGGSTLDTAKAVAALLANGGDPLEYLEVVGQGRPLIQPSLPLIAIPTTAGTGSEVTRNAVLASPEHQVKVSLRSPLMLPRVALVDPELTYGLPPEITASTGLDALTQLVEPFLCNRPNPLVDGLCRDGIPRVARSLRRACLDGYDAAAREDLALASLEGGMALANARLGAVHGLAAPLGGMFPAPHGATCARLLPRVLETNHRALRERDPSHDALRRMDTLGRFLTGQAPGAAKAIAWVDGLCRDLRIPPLRAYGVTAADIPTLVDRARVASSMQGNPIALTPAELAEILEKAL
jgi:alcohol dehydrogenase class IV